MSGEPEPALADGPVDPVLSAEFPGLRVRAIVVEGRAGKSPRTLRRRLEAVDQRFRGHDAIGLRTRPVPRAYRVFFRQIGLDPDTDRTPAEQVAVARLMGGGLSTGDRIADAIALAIVETGVAVLALDDAGLEGPIGLRPARAGETLPAGEHAHDLPAGRLVLADGAGPVAVLFGRVSDRHAPGRATRRLRLLGVQVPGVPEVHVAEALWLAAGALSDDGA